MISQPIIPKNITVHLGRPDESAQNVTVSFPDYIKNVASSEIYPTWPESSLRANIYAQISFALNRIYNEWYRSRGYDFDITNSTQFDQSFVNGRDIFENISRIVDDIFNNYINRIGTLEPLFAEYCSGRGTTCDGLSQWGTVELAEQGLGAYDILTNYYGNDIQIIENAPISENIESYTGVPLKEGDIGPRVRTIQNQLNRISNNYPAIPKIPNPRGVFDNATKEAVIAFQNIFNLVPDGIVGKSTWYKISYIYVNVKKLAELESEGVSLYDEAIQLQLTLVEGDRGIEVELLQYFLAVIAEFVNYLPQISATGVFDTQTKEAVIAFQRYANLEATGVVDDDTWYAIYNEYRGIIDTLPSDYQVENVPLYPGKLLRVGSRGEDVRLMQEYLNYISDTYTSIPKLVADGIYGSATRNAVREFQQLFDISPLGQIGAITWDAIGTVYYDLKSGEVVNVAQHSGVNLS